MGLKAEGVEGLSDRLLELGLADATESILDRQEFPVILEGDCTIVLGSMLALRRRGRYGLLFIDGMFRTRSP